jgi:hypothetical protein
MYFFKVNNFKDNYIKFTDLEVGNINNFDFDKVYLVKLEDINGETLKQQHLVGFFNEADSTIYFTHNIENSLIVYNGIETIKNRSYIIRPDRKSIKFQIPHEIYNINNELEIDDDSEIFAINFYSGNFLDNDYITPRSEITVLANVIIKNYQNQVILLNKKINKLEAERDLIVDDYDEVLELIDGINTEFKLKHIPLADSLLFYINGVMYEENIYWYFDNSNNKIIWTYDEESGGFDITNDYNVHAVYDYKKE